MNQEPDMAGRARRKHSIPARDLLLKGKGFWQRIASVWRIFSTSQRFLPVPITWASNNYHPICILRFKFDSLEESIVFTVLRYWRVMRTLRKQTQNTE
jgi:hypothetical protein